MSRGQYDRGRKPFASASDIVAMTVSSGDAGMVTLPVGGAMTDDDGVPVVLVESRRRPISEAPKNGETILLFSAEIRHGIRGCWKKTRRFAGGRWTQNEFWSCPMTNTGLGMSWTEWEPV